MLLHQHRHARVVNNYGHVNKYQPYKNMCMPGTGNPYTSLIPLTEWLAYIHQVIGYAPAGEVSFQGVRLSSALSYPRLMEIDPWL